MVYGGCYTDTFHSRTIELAPLSDIINPRELSTRSNIVRAFEETANKYETFAGKAIILSQFSND